MIAKITKAPKMAFSVEENLLIYPKTFDPRGIRNSFASWESMIFFIILWCVVKTVYL